MRYKRTRTGDKVVEVIGFMKKHIIIIVILVIIFAGFKRLVDSEPSSYRTNNSEQSISHSAELAYNVISDEIRNRLKSPSSAKFPGLFDRKDHTKYLGNNLYEVNSYVDSQNSFGAMVRSTFSAKITFIGSKYRVTEIVIN